jgi:hypothetical protein
MTFSTAVRNGIRVELLEDESNLFGAHAIQIAGGNAGNILPVEPDFAGGRAVEAADQIHQRRFARSGRAHDREPFSRRDVQRDVVESVNGLFWVLAAAVPGFLRGVELVTSLI